MPFAQDIHVPLCPAVSGENAWLIRGYRGAGIMFPPALQQTFLYASEAEASQAYHGVVANMAGCQAFSRSMQSHYGVPSPVDAVVTEITGTAQASAWTRSWTAVNTAISGGGPQTDIEYIAQQGPAISFFDFELSGLDQAAPGVASSAALLATMTSELGAYGQGS
jgi:hypothetical protein